MSRKYTKEFKEQAILLVLESSVKEVSERLGVTRKTLYRWRQESRLEGGPQAMHSDLEKQNRELRKENLQKIMVHSDIGVTLNTYTHKEE